MGLHFPYYPAGCEHKDDVDVHWTNDWFELQEFRVIPVPTIHEVIQAMTGCPLPTEDESIPCVTDACVPWDDGRPKPPGPRQCNGYHRPVKFSAVGGYGQVVDVEILSIDPTTITVRPSPAWAFRKGVDTTITHEVVDRMTGRNSRGNHIPEAVLSRIEMYYAGRL